MKKKLLHFFLFFCVPILVPQLLFAAAKTYPLNQGWKFHLVVVAAVLAVGQSSGRCAVS